LSVATRQLSVLMLAGLPLVNALSTLAQQLGESRLARVFAQVRDSVNEGICLAKALQEHPGVFPPIYVSMVEAAETAGNLESVLSQLADLYERHAQMAGKVKGALAYPLFMLVAGAGVVVFVLSFVLPSITKLFVEMKMRLPWPTVVLIRTSDILSHYFWLLAVAGVGLVAGGMYWTRTESGGKVWDRLKLKSPVLGGVVLKVAISRFCRMLGVLLSSGVAIVEALKLSERVVGNRVLAKAVGEAGEAVGHGESLADSLGKSGVFPPLVVNTIAAGEQSGTVEEGLSRLSDFLDGDVQARLSVITALLEPILILVLGAIVGFIVLAMLLPIFDINQAVA
jgi:general secretion pathway protein F